MMQRIPRIVWLVCAVLLVAAVFRLPYGYYNFLRIVICGAAALIAIASLLEETQSGTVWTVVFVLVAILFNPIVPIHFRRSTWFYPDLTTFSRCIASL
jgi:hypothetical protein